MVGPQSTATSLAALYPEKKGCQVQYPIGDHCGLVYKPLTCILPCISQVRLQASLGTEGTRHWGLLLPRECWYYVEVAGPNIWLQDLRIFRVPLG